MPGMEGHAGDEGSGSGPGGGREGRGVRDAPARRPPRGGVNDHGRSMGHLDSASPGRDGRRGAGARDRVRRPGLDHPATAGLAGTTRGQARTRRIEDRGGSRHAGRSRSRLLEVVDDPQLRLAAAGQRPHGDGADPGLRRRAGAGADHHARREGRAEHGAADRPGSQGGRRTRDPDGRQGRVRRAAVGGRHPQGRRLDRGTLRGLRGASGREGPAAVLVLFARADLRPGGVPARRAAPPDLDPTLRAGAGPADPREAAVLGRAGFRGRGTRRREGTPRRPSPSSRPSPAG